LCSVNGNFWFKTFIFGLSIFFVISPVIVWDISKKKIKANSVDRLTDKEKEYFKEISLKTWNFFSDFMNKENNYLPPDNYQESRRDKVVDRTSSTNIGLRNFGSCFCL